MIIKDTNISKSGDIIAYKNVDDNGYSGWLGFVVILLRKSL